MPSAGDYFHLGRALQAQGRIEEAVASYRESLRLNPVSVAALNNLGDALTLLGQTDEAEQALREALRRKADFPEAHNNLGIALARQGRLDEAERHHRESLRLNPASASAHNNLGNVLREQGQFAEGLACLDQALRLRPDYAEAHRNRGMTLLLLGDWEQGWREYEWRRRCPEARPPERLPLWDGAPLGGRTILLRAEQGMGDTLQFIRYAPIVQQRGGRVVVACPASLVRLLTAAPGIDRVLTAENEGIAVDVWIPLPSLPGIFGTTPTTVPGRVPYLFADPALVAEWRQQWASLQGFKIGIVWQGNPKHSGDRWRSVPLSAFAPITALGGIHLFSLQMGAGCEQIPSFAERFPLVDLSGSLRDFMDTAAVLMNLDLVITVDTAVAHLAGALGVPVWLALPWPAEWRWLLEREETPWYPSMRLFRQTKRGDWESVFTRIAAEASAYFGLSKTLSSKRL
jgi:Tfp pilus assembly protein PilF